MTVLTGVGGHFCCAHRSPEGHLHGHTWSVRAWWPRGEDARDLLARLNAVTARLDHTQLPDAIASGESLACHIAAQLGGDVVEVEISRDAERIFARWRR
jgi:hypothetical protein